LRTNGLPEAMIAARGAIAPVSTEEMLSLLPNLARPEAKKMLVIGLGGGLALDAVPPSMEEVDVFELEPLVVEANRVIAKRRDRNFLADPRVRVVCNDARGGLALTNKKYDVIVSQPSHPWTAGASHLYTREFMEEVQEHLTDRGVFAQWIDINFVDQPLLQSLGATLLDVFPHVRLYRPAEDSLVFLASAAPLAMEEAILETDHPLAQGADFYRKRGLRDVHNVAAMLTFDRPRLARFCKDAPLNTDDSNRLATRSLGAMSLAAKKDLEDALAEEDALLDSEGLRQRLNLNVDYLARLLHDQRQAERADRLVQSIGDPGARRLAQARYELHQGKHRESAASLEAVLEAKPQSPGVPEIQALLAVAKRLSLSEEIRSELKDPTKAVIEAMRSANQNDWDAVEATDSRLSLATPQDACFPYALLLRVRWRNESAQTERAEEALQLLEQAIPLSYKTMFLLPWARTGLLVGDDAVVLGAVEKRIRIARGMKKKLLPGDRIDFVEKHEAILDAIEEPDPDLVGRITRARAQLQSLLR
ncbi:MAG: fused MFS/spermidine synthase, partial [Planctomycetota bacterium]|nr:fused MFS/spermidine synthase [Planctomycetota bacterium]